METKFGAHKRKIEFVPAYDTRKKANCGYHNLVMNFVLSHPHGAVVLELATQWVLSSVHDSNLNPGMRLWFPSLSWHSPVPTSPEEPMSHPNCGHIGDRPCWSAGDTYCVDSVISIDRFLEEGEEYIWSELTTLWMDKFSITTFFYDI